MIIDGRTKVMIMKSIEFILKISEIQGASQYVKTGGKRSSKNTGNRSARRTFKNHKTFPNFSITVTRFRGKPHTLGKEGENTSRQLRSMNLGRILTSLAYTILH